MDSDDDEDPGAGEKILGCGEPLEASSQLQGFWSGWA